MRYIEPHAHMVSRVTDDYDAMVTAGCAAVCEPAFWAGFDRSGVQGFYDYFCQLTDFEPKRAAKYALPHFCWLCINPKESEDMVLAKEVLSLIPESKSQIIHMEMPPDDPKLRKPDIARAKSILGWQPLIDRREGLKRMIDFYRDDLKKK